MEYMDRNGKEVIDNIGEQISNKIDFLDKIAEEISRCTDCELYRDRKKTVPGHYPKGAFSRPVRIIFLGEAPGAMENEIGEPFVGKSGEVFNELLPILSLTRKDIFIFNTACCRPPKNRTPTYEEMFLCAYHLYRQIGIIQPHLIVAMGASAIHVTVQSKRSDFTLSPKHKKITVGESRNQVHNFTCPLIDGIPEWKCKVITTYHPAALLRGSERRSSAEHDYHFINEYINILLQKMGL